MDKTKEFLINNWQIIFSSIIAGIGVLISVFAYKKAGSEGKIKKRTYLQHLQNQLYLLSGELYKIKNSQTKLSPIQFYSNKIPNLQQKEIYNEYRNLVFSNVTLSEKELLPFIGVLNFIKVILLTDECIGEEEMDDIISSVEKILKKYQPKITKKTKIKAYPR